MADRGGEFSFFHGISVRIYIRIDISISIRPMIPKFGKQVHLQDVSDVIKSRSLDKLKTFLHYQSVYGHLTWQDGNLPWWAPAQKITWPFDHVVL